MKFVFIFLFQFASLSFCTFQRAESCKHLKICIQKKKNQFQILVEWSYLSLNYTKKRGFVRIEMMNFPAQ